MGMMKWLGWDGSAGEEEPIKIEINELDAPELVEDIDKAMCEEVYPKLSDEDKLILKTQVQDKIKKEVKTEMASIKDEAKEYEPQHMKGIADLEAVSVEQEIVRDESRENSAGKKYKVSYILIDGEEYRVPNTVLEQLQTLLEEKPDLKSFKVSKKGEGLNTKYTLIQLE